MARILVVDDQQSIRDLLRAALSDDSFGCHDVTLAADGATALSLLDVAEFDLLLTNVGMPVMDGVELADTVRARQPRLPVLLGTGRPVERLPLRGSLTTSRSRSTSVTSPTRSPRRWPTARPVRALVR